MSSMMIMVEKSGGELHTCNSQNDGETCRQVSLSDFTVGRFFHDQIGRSISNMIFLGHLGSPFFGRNRVKSGDF